MKLINLHKISLKIYNYQFNKILLMKNFISTYTKSWTIYVKIFDFIGKSKTFNTIKALSNFMYLI